MTDMARYDYPVTIVATDKAGLKDTWNGGINVSSFYMTSTPYGAFNQDIISVQLFTDEFVHEILPQEFIDSSESIVSGFVVDEFVNRMSETPMQFEALEQYFSTTQFSHFLPPDVMPSDSLMSAFSVNMFVHATPPNNTATEPASMAFNSTEFVHANV